MPRTLIASVTVLAAVFAVGYWAWTAVPAGAPHDVSLDQSRPRPQGDYYVGAVAEPANLNPFTTQDAVARRYVLRYTHDTLMDLDPATGELRPALAESVESSEDGREHVFTLRRGVLFSDGNPLELRDLLFTHEVATTPDAPLGAFAQVVGLIESVEAVPPDGLRIRLREATKRAFGIVATGYFAVSSRFFAQNTAAASAASPGPGTGPYMLGADGWRAGVDLTLTQNPHSWRRSAHPELWNLAGIKLVFLGDRSAQFAALRRQEIDWLASPEPDALLEDPLIAQHYRSWVYDYIHLGHYLIVWNHRRDGLGDPRVRAALTQCFDRPRIVEHLMGGQAQPAATWLKPGTPGAPDEISPLPFDPERARELLRASGFDAAEGRPLRLSLIHASTEDLHRQIVELTRPAFARAGVELTTEALPLGAMVERLGARDFDGMLVVMGLERWNDPYSIFHSSQSEAGRNWMGYTSPDADRSLEMARAQRDDALHRAALEDFCRVFHRDQPVTLLAHPLAAILLHRRFRGVEPGALGLVPEAWWVEPDDMLHR